MAFAAMVVDVPLSVSVMLLSAGAVMVTPAPKTVLAGKRTQSYYKHFGKMQYH